MSDARQNRTRKKRRKDAIAANQKCALCQEGLSPKKKERTTPVSTRKQFNGILICHVMTQKNLLDKNHKVVVVFRQPPDFNNHMQKKSGG
jgi:hypothetical protein